jgi:hypothetical protein
MIATASTAPPITPANVTENIRIAVPFFFY